MRYVMAMDNSFLQFLLKLSDALRPLSDPVAIQAEAARVLGEHLAASRVLYGEVSDDGEYFIIERNYVAEDVPELTGRFRMSDFGPALVAMAKAGRTIVLSDIATAEELTPAERSAYNPLGVAAVVGIPLIKDGNLLANLNVHASTPRAWTEDEIAIIEATAERTWSVVERARAEARLREAEQRRLLAMEATGVGDWDFDPVSGAVNWSPRMYELYGLPDGSKVDLDLIVSLSHPDDAPAVLEAHDLAMTGANEGKYVGEFRVTHPDGTVRWLQSRGQVLFHEGGGQRTPARVIGTLWDITAQKVAEALKREQGIVNERQEFARNLHDAVSQTLFTASLLTETLPVLWERRSEQIPGLLADVNRLIKGAQAEMRSLLLELRPTSIETATLKQLLSQLVDAFRGRKRTEILFECDVDLVLPIPVLIAAYRVAQESLNNVTKHAQASHAQVSVEGGAGYVEVQVIDDGVGFILEDMRVRFGLRMMRERADEVGARLDIQTAIGQGTQVRFQWAQAEQGA